MRVRYALVVVLLMGLALVACGGGDGGFLSPTVEPVEETPTAAAQPTAPELPTQAAPTATPTNESPPPAAPTATTAPRVSQPAPTPVPQRAPNSGEWIDVDVSTFTVRLMNGTTAVRVIGPVGVGREIDTGVWESTATGLFYVYSMNEALVYDEPYDTYISHWVGFDPSLANGFHSLLKDKDGNVEDASTGRVSNGCIRVGEAQAVYDFAEIGMPVWVHT